MKAFRCYPSMAVICCVLLAACGSSDSDRQTASRKARPTTGGYKIGEPYKIGGVYYYPAENYGYAETGIASWYGPKFNGRLTANGERFDMNMLSAAHRTLPLPSMVRVTNLENGRTLAIRINDRGPFARGRIIDLSRRAAQLLGFSGRGTARVRVEIMARESRRMAMLAKRFDMRDGERILASATSPAPLTVEPLPAPGQPASRAVNVQEKIVDYRRVDVRSAPPPDFKSAEAVVEYRPVHPTSLYIQAGAFVEYTNAARLRTELERYARARVTEAVVGNQRYFRVRLGPLSEVESADRLLDQVVASGYPQARLIVD